VTSNGSDFVLRISNFLNRENIFHCLLISSHSGFWPAIQVIFPGCSYLEWIPTDVSRSVTVVVRLQNYNSQSNRHMNDPNNTSFSTHQSSTVKFSDTGLFYKVINQDQAVQCSTSRYISFTPLPPSRLLALKGQWPNVELLRD
jgi:hypothetical protein